MVLKFLLTFSAGIYCGIYLTQNYDIPEVYEPKELLAKVKDFLSEVNDKYKKDGNDGNRRDN